MKSLQGQLLAASPHLPDPNFFRTVVLLVQHHEQGALGLVLNRPSQNTVRDVFQKVSDVVCESEAMVGVGGPISGPLMAVHAVRSCSESDVLPGVYFATQRDHLLRIVRRSDSPFRMFSGYAGWAGGQLESELKVGGWLMIAGTADYIFKTAVDELWKTVTRDISDSIVRSALNIKHSPHDPSAN
jgi:putative transcriptional regulator